MLGSLNKTNLYFKYSPQCQFASEDHSPRFPWLSSKEPACQCRRQVQSLSWEDTLEKWQPTPIFLLGKFHGQRSLAGYSPWCHKRQT